MKGKTFKVLWAVLGARETGAVIRVKPQEGGATHQTVQIFGDPLQANRAHKMVVDALAKYDPAKARPSPNAPGEGVVPLFNFYL